MMHRLLIIFVLIFSSLAPAEQRIDLSMQKEIEHAIIRGLEYLHDQQEENGSWQYHTAITGLVLSSFLRAHPAISEQDSIIARGFDFLKSCIHDNGGIYNDDMQTYSTSICIMAFKDADNLLYDPIIRNAQSFIMSMQKSEENGVPSDSINYGGVSYGKDDKPCNLSNLQWALEAVAGEEQVSDDTLHLNLAEKKFEEKRTLFFDRAILFLQRCQNLKAYNDQSYSVDDGGFMYSPGTSKAGETHSYGSMTYAGLKSFIHASVSASDPRVEAALKWLQKHYSVEENPGMGMQGLYYYYHTMAKALSVADIDMITTTKQKNHYWRHELVDQLLQIQNADGSWVNSNGRWWENNPVLVTAYVVLSLEKVLEPFKTSSLLPDQR
jgi:squalene-hopene/tetraprenyl-beta-curcumene cyclase